MKPNDHRERFLPAVPELIVAYLALFGVLRFDAEDKPKTVHQTPTPKTKREDVPFAYPIPSFKPLRACEETKVEYDAK